MKPLPPLSPQYYTPQEAAAILRVSQTTIYNWLRDKTLDGMKIGARWRVVATALQPPAHENTSRLPNAASP